jgi:hypothetical protein
MEVRFHGEIPEHWRDHGVFQLSPEGAMITENVPANPATHVEQLTAKKAQVDVQLAALLDKVKAATANPQETAKLSTLADESQKLAKEVESARAAADEQQATLDAQQQAAKRGVFDESVKRGHEQRARFFQLYRETCLAFGRFCATVDEVSALANSQATQLGVWPQHSNAVRDLSADLNPLTELLDGGLRPTMKFGWNLNLTVVPLQGEK